jgi:hypothetical protein
MYQLKPIPKQELLKLKELVAEAQPPIGDQLKKVLSAPGIGNNKSGRFDSSLLTLIPLGTDNNTELLSWLESYTGIQSKFITNIHLNCMKEGAYFKPHYDNYHIDVSDTYTFLLEEPVEGGEFILDSKTINIDSTNVVVFNGGKYLHGVSKVKKGTRKSFIVFYFIPSNDISKDLV